jgi:RecB family exonuclease
MKILFGMNLDGVVWHDGQASLGSVRTGPLGLLGILESKLGLSRPAIHPVKRIDQYMKRLEEKDSELRWYHKSFAVDPWSTAREMLLWRDELVEAGWKGQLAAASPRLEELAEIENMDSPLSIGRADRLREVIESLENKLPTYIESISLVDPIDMVPPVWQEVFVLLKSQGTVLDLWEKPELVEGPDNLSLIQKAFCSSAEKGSLSEDDDSLILLKADNEWEAAEQLALWLVSNKGENEDVTIICGMETGVLDRALKRHGLPSLGRSVPSRWRETQQILPLVLANAWEPVDIGLLSQLLSLTISPFPRWVCRYLLEAISQEPGLGGRAWNNALNRIEERRKEEFVEKGNDNAEERAELFIKSIQALLLEDRFDPADGIPEEKLRDRCQIVIELLGWRLESDPGLVEVVSHARDMQDLSKGKGTIPKITLERILDTVIGVGSISNEICEEAGSWKVVDHPGQIVDSCGEIVWWGFNDSLAFVPTFWSLEERSALKSSGVVLEESRSIRRREAHTWQQCIACAQRRFIAVHIGQIDGEEVYHHPYWDSIWCMAEAVCGYSSEELISKCLVKECKDYDHKRDWKFAGRSSVLESAPEWKAQPASVKYYVPESVIGPPKRMSYSQMSTLIGCPMKWALEYHAGIRMSQSQVVPTGNQMIGTLCHRIIEDLYEKDQVLDRDEACVKTAGLYDELLSSMASELLLDENAIEMKRYRIAILEAVGQLIEALNKLDLRVEKTEAPLEGSVDGIPFIGYADLLLRDSYDNAYILDLKWSNYSKYRKQEMEEGSSLQLATYAWMIRSSEHLDEVDTGYFMLAQGELLSHSKDLAEEAVESPYSLDEIWKMGLASYRDVWEQLDSGLVEASGVKELFTTIEEDMKEEEVREGLKAEYREKGMLYQKPSCRFCDYSRLCGLSGGIL